MIVSSFDQPVALGVDRISNPCGASRFAQRLHERGRVGDMLDDFHAGDKVELSFQSLEIAGAIINGQAGRVGVVSRCGDQFRLRHPTR